MHVMLLKTICWMSFHQNLSIRLISILLFSSYCRLRMVSANICWGKQKFVSSFPQGVQTRQWWIVSLNLPTYSTHNPEQS